VIRGFSMIGLERPKTAENVGGVLRAAHCYNVAQVVIAGPRVHAGIHHCTNTPAAERHLPVLVVEDVLSIVPFGTEIVVVDKIDGARPLYSFQHPLRALYVFGPEDGTLGRKVTSRAQHVVYVPTRNCMNLAACVNVVLYDRAAKADRSQRAEEQAGECIRRRPMRESAA
jgi:tRNA(Leu) C34 or U34 (ribose-2'-O)-methylase TrmL